jgi:hypothetical protein
LFDIVVSLVVGPLLVAAATLAARRWGARAGGAVSALPAIVGPVLLIAARRQGAAAAADVAAGTLAGLAALSAFALAYARAAGRGPWPVSLAAGWLAAGVAGGVVGAAGAGVPVGLAIAIGSLTLAHRGLPAPAVTVAALRPPRDDLALRMGLTAALILALGVACSRLGPTPGGVLAALPVLASILASFTHARGGAPAAVELLRGMLGGMTGFVAFCAIVGALVVPAGIPAAFALAVAGTLAAHGLALTAMHRRGSAISGSGGAPRLRRRRPDRARPVVDLAARVLHVGRADRLDVPVEVAVPARIGHRQRRELEQAQADVG